MADNNGQQISAADLLKASARRGEKTATELGYGSGSSMNSTKPTTYIYIYIVLNVSITDVKIIILVILADHIRKLLKLLIS